MTLWIAFKVQRTTGAAAFCPVFFSVGIHALVLVVLAQYSMRAQTALNLDKQDSHPPVQVMLLTRPMTAFEAMVTKADLDPGATSLAHKVQQQVAKQLLPQVQLPLFSSEAHAKARPVEGEAQDAGVTGNPSDAPDTAPKLIAGVAEQSRSDANASQASASPAEKPLNQQPSQGARPDYAYNPQPEYPMLLREQGVGGVVWLRVWVNSEGRPVEIKVAKGSGYRLLDDAALRAVQYWRFIPAKNGEKRLASWVEFPIRFTLNG